MGRSREPAMDQRLALGACTPQFAPAGNPPPLKPTLLDPPPPPTNPPDQPPSQTSPI